MGGHLADGKYRNTCHEHPDVRIDGQDRHADSPQGDSRHHRGQGLGLSDDHRNEELEQDDNAGIDDRHMLHVEEPVDMDAENPQKTIDGGIQGRCIDIRLDIP